ncbi:MAG TPA: cytochrome o ubiquinol oxidase subunit IV [Steroidobacteraceae bacterium]|jgi:cytochrome o ubiquinol oxidase operon protein cyoD|nr:cytochrome o ubiquinol oxidase subunit IV [Steroidobacteraceae bacterium]
MMQETAAAEPESTRSAQSADEGAPPGSIVTYTVGLVFALLLTGASFIVSQTDLLWAPGVPAGLAVLAIAQMGVHLVFFLHISTGADNTNNVVALAFGLLIVTLIVSGSLWIMAHLNTNMVPMSAILEMHR